MAEAKFACRMSSGVTVRVAFGRRQAPRARRPGVEVFTVRHVGSQKSPSRPAPCVAPSWMATSKSPLMPIDSSRSIGAGTPEASHSSRRSRSRRNQGRASSGVSGTGGSVISPTTRAARHAAAASKSRGTSSGGDAELRRFPGEVHLDQQFRRVPGSSAAAIELLESSTLSTDWIIANAGAAFRALFVCRWPSRCHLIDRSARFRAIFCRASWTRFSPKSRWPAAYASRTASMGKVLETATSRTEEGSRPADRAAAAMRARISASRSAMWTSSGSGSGSEPTRLEP